MNSTAGEGNAQLNVTTRPNPGDSTSNTLGIQIAEYIIISLGLCTNFFICFAFAYYRRVRTVNNYFVFNLAISDTLLLIIFFLWRVAVPSIQNTLTEDQEGRFILFMITFEVFCGSASIATLTILSYDRFYSVTKPLHYTANITGRKAVILIVCIWLYALGISLLRLVSELPNQNVFKNGYIPLWATCNVLIPLVITLYCYITIFVIASRHLRHNPHHSQDANSLAYILTKNLKIAFHILVLVAPLMLAWSAYYTITVVEVHCDDCVVLTLLEDWIISNLPSILGTVDPIIYILLTKDFRKILFGCFRRKNRRLFVSETYHLSTTKATTTQASPVSSAERRMIQGCDVNIAVSYHVTKL